MAPISHMRNLLLASSPLTPSSGVSMLRVSINSTPRMESMLINPSPLLHELENIEAIFSDMDGTLVHYENAMKRQGYRLLNHDNSLCETYAQSEHNTSMITRHGVEMGQVTFVHEPTQTRVPCVRVPSLTLGGGYVSIASLELAEVLRTRFGVKIVLMTGARTSTMLMRRKSGTIPIVDYDVCEGGGKVWEVLGRPALEDPVLCPSWTEQFQATTGPLEQMDTDPVTRQGPLWDVFRLLHEQGFHLDAKSFSTSFLVDLSKSRPVVSGGQSIQTAEAALRELFASDGLLQRSNVTYISNLGKGQVCPIGCNKRTAMEYLANIMGVAMVNDASTFLPTSIALFDDENDLEFARCCAVGFIPSIAHQSVLDTLADAQAAGKTLRWQRTPVEGPLGTEYALREVLKFKEAKEASRKTIVPTDS